MNIYEIVSPEEIVKLDVSQQEKIRLLFRVGMSRNEIRKFLGIDYQIVFRACNPKYSPKRWVNVLSTRLEEERKNKVSTPETEVPLFNK